MKPNTLLRAAAAIIMIAGLQPEIGWATKLSTLVVGEVTATPTSGQIEVDHRIYQVKKPSTPNKSLHIGVGQKVDLVLDGPPDSKTASVISIKLHAK
jgi:hypothetical protein